MNLHDADIQSRLKRFLERRTMPKSLEGKPQAIADELGAMARIIAKFANRSEFGAWWGRFEADLGERNATRSWPSEGEISASCKAVSNYSGNRIAEQGSIDPHRIAANRIAKGEAVGDEWIYGRRAGELVEKGLATEGQLRAYRSALFFRMKKMWGEDVAKKAESELIARHEGGKEFTDGFRGSVSIPDNRHVWESYE